MGFGAMIGTLFALSGALAHAAPPSGCEWLATTKPQNGGPTVAELVTAAGCTPQCVGFIFCMSDVAGKFDANDPPLPTDKLFNAVQGTCDANANGTCPLPEDCRATLAANPGRLAAKATAASSDSPPAAGNPVVQYGAVWAAR